MLSPKPPPSCSRHCPCQCGYSPEMSQGGLSLCHSCTPHSYPLAMGSGGEEAEREGWEGRNRAGKGETELKLYSVIRKVAPG